MKTLLLVCMGAFAFVVQFFCPTAHKPQQQPQTSQIIENFTSTTIITATKDKKLLVLPQNKTLATAFILQVDKLPENFSKNIVQDARVAYTADELTVIDAQNNKIIFCLSGKCTTQGDAKTKIYKGLGLIKISSSEVQGALIKDFNGNIITFEPMIEACNCVTWLSSASCLCAGGPGSTACSCSGGGGGGCSVSCNQGYYACCNKSVKVNNYEYQY